MGLMAKTKSGNTERKLIPEGVHIAVCDLVCDLGLQEGFEGGDAKHQAYIRWQLPNERIQWEKDGVDTEGPMVIGGFYTISTHPKSKMRPMLESWLDRDISPDEEENGFDLFELIELPASLYVKHKKMPDGSMRALLLDVSPYNGKKEVKVEGLPITHEGLNTETLELLPEWLQKKVNNQIMPDEIPI